MTAEAVEVASIDELCVARTAMLPPVAVTDGTPVIVAARSVATSLRETLSATVTPVALSADAATASTGASTNE